MRALVGVVVAVVHEGRLMAGRGLLIRTFGMRVGTAGGERLNFTIDV